MRIYLYAACAAAFLTSGAVTADDVTVTAEQDSNVSTPIELSVVQLDQITAGSLKLPNGKDQAQFENFDNPSPDQVGVNFCDDTGIFCHPALTRRSGKALTATAGKTRSVDGFGNDGPWMSTAVSPVITCVGFEIPAGLGDGPVLGSGCSE